MADFFIRMGRSMHRSTRYERATRERKEKKRREKEQRNEPRSGSLRRKTLVWLDIAQHERVMYRVMTTALFADSSRSTCIVLIVSPTHIIGSYSGEYIKEAWYATGILRPKGERGVHNVVVGDCRSSETSGQADRRCQRYDPSDEARGSLKGYACDQDPVIGAVRRRGCGCVRLIPDEPFEPRVGPKCK